MPISPELISQGASILTDLGGKALTKRETSTDAQNLRAAAKSEGKAVKKACGRKPRFSLLNKKKLEAWNKCQESYNATQVGKANAKASTQMAIANQEQAANNARILQSKEESKTKFNKNLIIGGSILGGLILIVATVLIIKKRRSS